MEKQQVKTSNLASTSQFLSYSLHESGSEGFQSPGENEEERTIQNGHHTKLDFFIQGYSNGTVLSTCGSMKPGHGPDFLKGKGPYTLVLMPNVKEGFVNVEIKTSKEPFKGVFFTIGH